MLNFKIVMKGGIGWQFIQLGCKSAMMFLYKMF
jgi:hypothetical protein